jgi:hypothetical protein
VGVQVNREFDWRACRWQFDRQKRARIQLGPDAVARRISITDEKIIHQTIRMHPPARLNACFAQRVEKTLAVRVILEDRFAPVATVSHTCPAVAAELQMPPGSVAVAVHRLRSRFRELVRAEVAETVANPMEVDGELGHLGAALQ